MIDSYNITCFQIRGDPYQLLSDKTTDQDTQFSTLRVSPYVANSLSLKFCLNIKSAEYT